MWWRWSSRKHARQYEHTECAADDKGVQTAHFTHLKWRRLHSRMYRENATTLQA